MEGHIPFYRKIFFSTTKYLFLKNIFIVVAAILSIYIVRFLGPAEYGKYFLIIQIASTIGPILNLGWLSTLAKHLPEYKDISQKKELFSNAVATILVSIIIFVSLFLLAGSSFNKFIPKEICDIRYIFLFLICAVALTNLAEGAYRGLGKFNDWALFDGIRGVVSALLILSLLSFLKQGYRGAVMGNFLISVIFLITIFLFIIRYLKIPNFEIKTDILKFTSIIFIGQVLTLFISNVDPVLLRWLLRDPTYVGYYFAGSRIPKLVEVLFLGQLVVPFLYYFTEAGTSLQHKKIIETVTRILGVICGLGSLFLFAFSKEIISILFSKVFEDSIIVMRIYSFWIFLISLQIFVSPFFLAINKPHILLFTGFMFFIFNFLFDLILIPRFFAAGAALGAIFAALAQIYLHLYFYEKNGINLLKDITCLITGVVISIAAGVFFFYPVSLIIFPIYVVLTKQITVKDFDNFKTILFKKEIINVPAKKIA